MYSLSPVTAQVVLVGIVGRAGAGLVHLAAFHIHEARQMAEGVLARCQATGAVVGHRGGAARTVEVGHALPGAVVGQVPLGERQRLARKTLLAGVLDAVEVGILHRVPETVV